MSTDLSTPRTLYLLDDNDDVRATAKWWLSGAGYDVIDFGDAQAAIDALAALDAAAITRACLLLDVRMPSMTGHGDVPLAVQAMEKGAITFLEKPFEDSALESALARAFEAGAQSQHTAAAEPDSAADDVPCPEYQRRHASLSPRELQVMQGVVEGKISKVIARELDISTKTVELHRSRVMAKMQADSVVHLIRMALGRRVL